MTKSNAKRNRLLQRVYSRPLPIPACFKIYHKINFKNKNHTIIKSLNSRSSTLSNNHKSTNQVVNGYIFNLL